MFQDIREDFKYVLSESGFDGESRWRSNRLFLCDSLQERESLARLLCRHIRRRFPEIPVLSFSVSVINGPDETIRHIAAILHAAAERWLSQSPFDALDLDSLTTFDLRMLVAETIKEFSQCFRWEKRPVFVMVIAGVTGTNPTLSILNYLRSVISEGEKITWIVFAPKMILDVVDPSGVSPFYNIFPIRDLETKFVTIPNPYISGPPVKGEMFFGRTKIMTSIQRSIVQGQQPIALWGPRRIGKTSILYGLSDLLRPYCFPVPVDLQGFVDAGDNISLLYWLIAWQILIRENDEFGESESLSSDQGIAYDELMSIVSRMEQRRRRKVVCLLDEIESLERWSKDGLIALGQFGDTGLVGCIVGALRVKEWLFDPTLPIFGVFTGRKLGCLERAAAIELITRPVESTASYELGAINEILRLVGTHPMLVQLLCSSVLNVLNREGSTTVTTKTVSCAYQDCIKQFFWIRHLLENHDSLCLNLLEAFARIQSRTGQSGIGKEDLMKYVIEAGPPSAETTVFPYRVEQALEALCDEEILEAVGDGYNPKAQIYLDVIVPS